MIKIDEVCGILGLTADNAGKSKAREVLNYFGVKAETPPKVDGQFGAQAKLYDSEESCA